METNKSNQKITALSLKMSAAAMLLTCIGLALPRLTDQYGFGLWQQGALVSIQYIGFTVAVIIGGALSDKLGQQRVIAGSLIGAAAAMALFGSVVNYIMAVVAAILIGAFGSVLENAITAAVMRKENEKRDMHNVLVQVAFSAGAMLFPLVYLFSLKVLGNWRIAYYAAAVFALVLMLFSWKNADSKKQDKITLIDIFSQYKGFLKNPRNLIAPIAMFLYLGAEIGIWAFAPLYFELNGFGVMSGIVSSIFIWFLMLIGRMITARTVKKTKVVTIMIAASCAQIVILGMLFFASANWAVVLISLAGFACAPFFPLIMSWMVDITGDESSSMIALTMAIGTLGPVILSVITGIFSQIQGTQYLMAVPTICFVLLFVILIVFKNAKAAPKRL